MNLNEPTNRTRANLRAFKRNLLEASQQLRQVRGQARVRGGIKGFTKLYETNNADETYQILQDLNRVVKYEWTLNLRDVLATNYLGQDIRITYLNDARNVIRDKFYRVPATIESFNKWWDGKSWDWKRSDEDLFEEQGQGDVYIYQSELINPLTIRQSYLENETNTCIFAPLVNICNEKITENTPSSKNYKTLLNKILKLEKEYVKGVPDDKLEDVFKKMNVKMTLSFPFESTKKVVYHDNSKALMSLSYINTRINHVDWYDNKCDNIEFVVRSEFTDIHKDLWEKQEPFIYEKYGEYITTIKTMNKTYKVKSDTEPSFVFKEFEEANGLNDAYLCDIKDELVSKFIREGCKITSSGINSKYDDLTQFKKSFKEIDQVKSYTQFKATKFYEGFVGKITDFRKCNKIEANGFYMIKNIDWTNTDKKIKEIQRAFKIWYGRNVYSSVELKYLMSYGVKFEIIGGCWGVRTDFEFTGKMLDKNDGLPNYSKWTGAKTMISMYNDYYMDTNDREYVSHIKSKCENVEYFDGVMRFSVKKEFNTHLSHVSGFIYAYQRINLIEQLMEMDIDMVLRINTDGIKYIEHEFNLNSTFKSDITPNVNGLVMETREDGFITSTNNSNKRDLLRYRLHFNETHTREHFNNQLFIGAGGCGKTHYNLVDKGLIRTCYVANSYKLISAKKNDYKCDVEVLAIVEGRGYDNIEPFKKKYNNIIVDEASMISEEQKLFLFKTYEKSKLIFCGDIGFQAEPICGEEIKTSTFENVIEFKENHRVNDLNFLQILNSMRTCIKTNGEFDCNVFKWIDITEIKSLYSINDICLTYTKNKKKLYDDLEGEKYLITKSTDDYNRGEIVFGLPKHKNCEKTNAFTTHSVQGETFYNKIFIDEELVNCGNVRLLYTAVSRAKRLDQIYIVVSPYVAVEKKPKVEKPKVEKKKVIFGECECCCFEKNLVKFVWDNDDRPYREQDDNINNYCEECYIKSMTCRSCGIYTEGGTITWGGNCVRCDEKCREERKEEQKLKPKLRVVCKKTLLEKV
jgi:hypothetical protein